jgi:mono/diheme cytochrome c family protein
MAMRGFLFGFLVGSTLPPVIAGLVFVLGRSSIDATSNPPRWETILARRSFAASVARQAPKVQNPIPVNSDTLKAGLAIYRDACAGCHGDAGKPSQWGATDFYPRVPQFDSEPPTKPDWQMFWIVKHGVRYSGMGGVDGLMPDEKVWKVVGFLGHIGSLPPDVEAEWRGQQGK